MGPGILVPVHFLLSASSPSPCCNQATAHCHGLLPHLHTYLLSVSLSCLMFECVLPSSWLGIVARRLSRAGKMEEELWDGLAMSGKCSARSDVMGEGSHLEHTHTAQVKSHHLSA